MFQIMSLIFQVCNKKNQLFFIYFKLKFNNNTFENLQNVTKLDEQNIELSPLVLNEVYKKRTSFVSI